MATQETENKDLKLRNFNGKIKIVNTEEPPVEIDINNLPFGFKVDEVINGFKVDEETKRIINNGGFADEPKTKQHDKTTSSSETRRKKMNEDKAKEIADTDEILQKLKEVFNYQKI